MRVNVGKSFTVAAAAAVAAGNTLEGFGIVTLASLLPILAVELMAIITSFM
jgi:hypothetical protein